MENQVLVNGKVLLAKNNLVHLRNIDGIQLCFEVVDIDNGYVVLEPLDAKKFGNDVNKINEFVTGKPIIKGLINHT